MCELWGSTCFPCPLLGLQMCLTMHLSLYGYWGCKLRSLLAPLVLYLPSQPPQLQMVTFLTALESLLIFTHLSKICQKYHLTHSWNKQITACVTAIRSLDNFSRMKKHIKRRFWTVLSNNSAPIPFLKALGS